MKSLITILLLGLFASSEAQNISQSQVRQFNAVPAYRVFGRGSGVGSPSFLSSIDSNWIPSLHSGAYYDNRYYPLDGGFLRSNPVGSVPYYFGQIGGTDLFKIYMQSDAGNDLGELVFHVEDNGGPYAQNGERFRFHYGNGSSGTQKDPLILDYDTATFRTDIKANAYYYNNGDTVASKAYARSLSGGSTYTDSQARAAISLTTTGTSGAAIYNSSTGVLNIPQYTGGSSGIAKQLFVNLADYADSTGATDATNGINNAIAATPVGGVLFVGPGVFKTRGGHAITKKINLLGASGAGYLDYASYSNFRRGGSTIFLTSDSATLFTYSGESGSISNIDFRLDSTITPTTAIGFKVSGGTGIRFTNNSFYNFNTGLHIQNGGHWSVDKCFFEKNKTQAFKIENARLPDEGDASISNCWFYGDLATPPVGISFLSGGGLKIINTKFNNLLSTCIDVVMSSTSSILQVSNNSLENFTAYGIKINPSTIFQFPSIIGNEFAPYRAITGNCIYMNGATNAVKNAVVTNNVFAGANGTSNYAIQLTSVTGVELGLNRFDGWTNTVSTTNSTSVEAIQYSANSGSPTIAFDPAFVFGKEGSSTAANLYGIAVAKGGADYLMMGINKNTVTGSVPSGSTYLSTYSATGQMSLGRGNSAGLPNTSDIFIASDGKVGIGITSSLANKLHVYSTTSADGLSVDGNNNPAIVLRSSGVLKGYAPAIITSAGGFFTGTVAGDFAFRNEANKIHFGIGGSATMTIASATQVGINNVSPAASAALDITSTTKGVLFPRMTTTQRDAIASPAEGLTIYNLTTHQNETWNATAWAH